ncbi:hypothetical protein K432DRAFT_429082 [Lepidopterella palustris CBS 459.81]|uniref:Uncharacterized protein n=1 Tax=Lepidopterella palustris CBS 459.81 TaxID=1314670 RepID=A0A8E2E283_9PEZI|nr:hypothetical protein K432DRAFT_429082 [Lepidopterella palustris CBS 459.81]
MSHKTPSEDEVVSTLAHLNLSTKNPAHHPNPKHKSTPVADSWDEELSGDDTETEETTSTCPSRSTTSTSATPSPIKPISSYATPNPPPPTPASPTNVPFDFPDSVAYPYTAELVECKERGSSGTASPTRRPEKTTAVAGRLIAGALGVRAPKRTEEEREYDRVVREKEKKRREEERDRERREKEEAERRKKAVWED